MRPLGVLVVDDSVVMRRALAEVIATDPGLAVVGAAPSASIALQKITQLNPDVLVLDVEMPEMDGIEAVIEIRKTWAHLPIIMCSSLTERGAETTLRALAAGATDYVAKPTSAGGRAQSMAALAATLLPMIHAVARRGSASAPASRSASGGAVVTPVVAPVAAPVRPLPAPTFSTEPPSVIAIGSSTGGPMALEKVFAQLPAALTVPILVVQHMPPVFTRTLAERLTASSLVKVTEAVDGEELVPGRAYIAPGNFHMAVNAEGRRHRISLNQGPAESSCRPAIDVLFRSLPKAYGSRVLAAVLTGMGQDGTRGAGDIVAAGGAVLVQDLASCVVPSMPAAVIAAGLCAKGMSLQALGLELVARSRGAKRLVFSSPPPATRAAR